MASATCARIASICAAVGLPATSPIDFHAGLRAAVVRAEIQGDALPLEFLEVLVDLRGWHRGSAFAGDRRRDALAQLVLRQAVLEKNFSGLIHHVDPARGNKVSLRVDFAHAAPFDPADLGEAPVADRHVGAHPGVPRPVQNAAVADHHVVQRRGYAGDVEPARCARFGRKSPRRTSGDAPESAAIARSGIISKLQSE